MTTQRRRSEAQPGGVVHHSGMVRKVRHSQTIAGTSRSAEKPKITWDRNFARSPWPMSSWLSCACSPLSGIANCHRGPMQRHQFQTMDPKLVSQLHIRSYDLHKDLAPISGTLQGRPIPRMTDLVLFDSNSVAFGSSRSGSSLNRLA